MRKFVIVLGCCLVASPAAFAQTTTLNRPGSPYVAGEPFSPFPAPQYNVPGPQLTVPQTVNPLQPAPALGSIVNPLQPASGSTVNAVQQLVLQPPLQPGLPEAY